MIFERMLRPFPVAMWPYEILLEPIPWSSYVLYICICYRMLCFWSPRYRPSNLCPRGFAYHRAGTDVLACWCFLFAWVPPVASWRIYSTHDDHTHVEINISGRTRVHVPYHWLECNRYSYTLVRTLRTWFTSSVQQIILFRTFFLLLLLLYLLLRKHLVCSDGNFFVVYATIRGYTIVLHLSVHEMEMARGFWSAGASTICIVSSEFARRHARADSMRGHFLSSRTTETLRFGIDEKPLGSENEYSNMVYTCVRQLNVPKRREGA